MRIGRMRRTVLLIRRDSSTVSSTGALTGTWDTVREMWAGVEPVTGKEFWAGYADLAQAEINVLSRYWSDILVTDRFRIDGKDLEILAVLDVGSRHRELQMPCKWIYNLGDGANG